MSPNTRPVETPVQLVPLVCPRCANFLPAQPGEVAWVCDQCGQGLLLGGSPLALRPLDVFCSASVRHGQRGRPFWVMPGRVSITSRTTYKGDESRAAREFWAAPRLFFVPAWECALEELLSFGAALLKKPEPMAAGSPVPFLPVVTPPEDVQALAEFLVISLEAERRDAMKELKFDVTLDPPQLWVLS
jgi:hypothetical protein